MIILQIKAWNFVFIACTHLRYAIACFTKVGSVADAKKTLGLCIPLPKLSDVIMRVVHEEQQKDKSILGPITHSKVNKLQMGLTWVSLLVYNDGLAQNWNLGLEE